VISNSPRTATFLPVLLVLVSCLIGCSRSNPEEVTIRDVAKQEGADVGMAVPLESANKQFYENHPTESLFNEVINATRHSNEKTRLEAFKSLSVLRQTTFHSRALVEIERMKADSSQIVKDNYVWVSYLAENPNWRQICNEALSSGTEESQRLARLSLSYGKREPKRKTYAAKP
jgi:hypothetical protein